jgi:hypothetical protein
MSKSTFHKSEIPSAIARYCGFHIQKEAQNDDIPSMLVLCHIDVVKDWGMEGTLSDKDSIRKLAT